MEAKDIVDFWFAPESRDFWFRSTDEMDAAIRIRFQEIWRDARDKRLDAWKESAQGCLALVIILDQFPLNMFRNQPESFCTESKAREISGYAMQQGYEQALNTDEKMFLFLPFMHSENIHDQDVSVSLFEKAHMTDNLRWAQHHRDIIRKFGRFPHRNIILGRENTPAEQEYLASKEAFLG